MLAYSCSRELHRDCSCKRFAPRRWSCRGAPSRCPRRSSCAGRPAPRLLQSNAAVHTADQPRGQRQTDKPTNRHVSRTRSAEQMRGLQHRTGAEPGQGGPLPIFCVRNSSSQTTYGHAHRQPPPQRKVGVAQAKANLTWRLRAVTIMQFQNSTCTLSNSWLVLMSDRMSSMSAPHPARQVFLSRPLGTPSQRTASCKLTAAVGILHRDYCSCKP